MKDTLIAIKVELRDLRSTKRGNIARLFGLPDSYVEKSGVGFVQSLDDYLFFDNMEISNTGQYNNLISLIKKYLNK